MGKLVSLFRSVAAKRPRRRGLRLGGVLVLMASLVIAGLPTITPAAADGGSGPAGLLNLGGLTVTATPAQTTSLEDLEQQAVTNTLTDHGLPQSDFDAAETWGRDSAEGELWALLVQAINTPADQQTTDQANAVAWLSNLVLQQNIQAADDAGLEYAKWAGLGASAYQNLLTTDPSEAQIESFLSGTPLNYGPGDGPSTPESTSDEGYCLYDPPSGATTYTNNIFYDSGLYAPQTCFTPCTSLLGCLPPTPTESQFVGWGTADADEQSFDSSDWTSVDNDIAELLGYAAASWAAGAAFISVATSSALVALLNSTTLAAALSPFAGTSPVSGAIAAALQAGEAGFAEAQAGIAAADIGSVVGVVLTAITVGVIEAINVISAAEIPSQLAQLVYEAPTKAPDLASMLQSSSGAVELFSLFVNATLPEPTLSSCVNPSDPIVIGGPGGEVDNPAPCLNAPPVDPASSNDPTLMITPEGATTGTSSSTLDWESPGADGTESAYIAGNWFVDTETSGSSSFTFQTLDIHYTNWSGDQEIAWLGDDPSTGYEFITTQADASPPVDAATCLSAGTCSVSPSIEYVGADGDNYTASLAPPSGPPAIPSSCPQSTEFVIQICQSTSTSLTASPEVAEVGRPVQLTASTTSLCLVVQVGSDASACSAGPGTIDFVDDTGGPDVTLCSGVDASSGTATCTWTPTSLGTNEVYATFDPASGDDETGSQAEVDVMVGTLAPTTTTVAASSSTPALGAQVDYTATVADLYSGDPAPTGTVTFTNGSSVLCSSVGLVSGSDGYTATCSTSFSQAGAQTVTASYSGDSGTLASAGSSTVSVPPGPTTVNIQVPPVVVAGSPFSVGLQISAAGVPQSSVTGAATVFDEGNPSDVAQCSATIVGGAGTCEFTEATAGPLTLGVSYTEPYDNGASTVVTQAVTVDSPIITVMVSGSGVYGSANQNFTFTDNAPPGVGVAGIPACANVEGGAAVNASLPGGTHTLDGSTCSGLTLTGQFASEFSISYVGVDDGYVVKPVPLVVTASSSTMTYGGNVPEITATYQGFVNGDTASSLSTQPVCSTTATSSSPVGNYSSACSGAQDPSYTITYDSGQVRVERASLTITASSPAMTYGGPVPVITPIYSGFVNGDTASSLSSQPICSTAATSSSPVGTYPSTCSRAADPNYLISYQRGSVSVGQQTLTITATSSTMTYGGTVPAITPLYGGSTPSLATPPTCATAATSSSPVGTYASTCSGAASPNYAIGYVAGTVTVGQAPLTVTASSATMTYGSTVPAITATYGGFVNGDNASSLGTAPTCSTTATSSSPPGTYPTSCTGLADPNYDASYVPGTVTVGQAPLTITATSSTMTYGSTVPAIMATYGGFVNGDNASSLGTAPACTTSATSSSPPGTYPTTCTGAADPDYNITYVPGTVSVGQAPLTVIASSATMTYGSTVPAIMATYGGFVNGDNASSLGTAPTCSTTATSSSPPGIYPTSCTGAADPDYDITYVRGSMSVARARLTITASSATITQGETVPAITPAYGGFVNGDSSASLAAAPTCSTTATSSSLNGMYPSTCSGAADPDYDIIYVPGTVTVNVRPPGAPSAPNSGTGSSGSASTGTGTTRSASTGSATTGSNKSRSGTAGGTAATRLHRPEVTSLSPAAGSRSGGTTVVIRGKWFEHVQKVSFGKASSHFKVMSAEEIIAHSPHGDGTVAVLVTTTGGTCADSKVDRFKYVTSSKGK